MERPMQDRAQPLLQPPVQLEWVQIALLFPQLFLHRRAYIRRCQQAFIGRHRLVMLALEFGPIAAFFLQLGRGKEVVVQWLPTLTVEIVDCSHQSRVFQSLIAEQLPHMRPVFLLHMAVVVFLVGAGPGEPDHFLAFLKIAQQMPVQELAPVVGVEAQQFKWQRGFHGSGGFHNAVRTFVPYRPVQVHPLRMSQ